MRFPQHVTYVGGAILPSHRDRNQLDDDVRAAYDRWKQRYHVPVTPEAGASLYRVALGTPGTPAHSSTVSEGQGYGMVIVSLMAGHDPQAQIIFDGLLSFALPHRSCGDERLMLWRIPNDGHGCASATDGAYNYNAGRDPWRLGTDGLINDDARALAAVARISAWAEDSTDGDPQQIRPGYRLDGTPLRSDYFTTFFAAPLGVAAMTVPSQQAWLNAIYDAVRQRQEGYYEDSITLLCMLVMTANFWDPTS